MIAGAPNQDGAIRCQAQTIAMPALPACEVVLLGAAVNGAQTNQYFTLKFADGSQQQWAQGFSGNCWECSEWFFR